MKEISVSGEVALVDDADWERLSAYRWRLYKGRHTNYAKTHIYIENRRTTKGMHQFGRKSLPVPTLAAASRNAAPLPNQGDSMNDPEFDQKTVDEKRAALRLHAAKETAFIGTRIDLALMNAAALAANFGGTEEDFVEGARSAYTLMAERLKERAAQTLADADELGV